MGRTEVLHPRQDEIDRILLSTAGRGGGEEALRLLRDAGVELKELGIHGDSRDGSRIAQLRNRAKARQAAAPPPGVVEAAQEASRLARVVQELDERLASARKQLEAAQRRLIEESEKLL